MLEGGVTHGDTEVVWTEDIVPGVLSKSSVVVQSCHVSRYTREKIHGYTHAH